MLQVGEIPTTTDDLSRLLLREAYRTAALSDDARTKTGAVIAYGDRILARGYNHFPPGLPEHLKQPPEKYAHVIHAEKDALQQMGGRDTNGLLMAMPWFPCMPCATLIKDAGVTLVSHLQLIQRSTDRWQNDLDTALQLFRDNNIPFVAYNGPICGVDHLFDGQIWYP